jgi:hypothetical protein
VNVTVFQRKLFRFFSAIAFVCLCLAAPRGAVAQSGPPPIPPGTVLDIWEFANTNYISDWDYSRSSVSNAPFVSTWAGSSLLVDDTNAAWTTTPSGNPMAAPT